MTCAHALQSKERPRRPSPRWPEIAQASSAHCPREIIHALFSSTVWCALPSEWYSDGTRETRSPLHLFRLSATLTLCLVGFMAQGCGGSQKHVAQQLQEESVLSNTAPLSDRLITQSEIRSASDEKALQTFLQVWSL